MDHSNPYTSPKIGASTGNERKHWRGSLVLSIAASFAFWLVLCWLLVRPTIDQWAGLSAILLGSTLGACLGFAKRWLTLPGAIVGGASVFAATVLIVVTFVESPTEVTGPFRLFPGLISFAGIGAGFGLLFGSTVTLVAWGVNLLLQRQRFGQHGTAAERSHLR